MVSKILMIAFIVGTASAATMIGRLPKKPQELAHKEGCYIEELHDVIPFGSTATPLGQCLSIGCGTEFLDYATCGTVGTDDPNCYKTDYDVSRPYPHCCPDIKCDLDNQLF